MTDVVRPSHYETEPIGPEDPTSGFRCGKHALDDFFKRHALDNDRRGLGKTYVLRQGGAVLGYYTLSMADVEPDVLAAPSGARYPRYPLPVALLGRLAVAETAQGKGIEARLLRDALRRVAALADQIGCVGVVVDAMDEEAARFYEKFGFESVTTGPWPRRMFLAIGTLRAAAG